MVYQNIEAQGANFWQVSVLVSSALVAPALRRRTVVAPGNMLRVQPLGDSITFGYLSPDGNGYRLRLQQDLAGSNLTFIGSVQSGNMTNNQNEGHPGANISEIQQYAGNSLPQKPNIVLIHAGTNDMNNDPPEEPYDTAPDRLGSLIDTVVAGASPNALVLVAQIIHAGNASTDARITTFNDAIPGVVAQRANFGQNVVVVDFRSITAADLQDGLHPSEEGYLKMGDIWFSAIQAAASKGLFKALLTFDLMSHH